MGPWSISAQRLMQSRLKVAGMDHTSLFHEVRE
jgi:hypothetical protein